MDPSIGTGNWKGFKGYPIGSVFAAAEQWAGKLEAVSHPWLCWNVSPRWSLVQQRLVKSVGWTPIVGFDPRVGPPPLEPGSILIDFNESFQFPVMWPHFPLEFAFLFAHRLAFWHADLLCTPKVMKYLANTFSALKDGETTAVLDRGGRRNFLNFKSHRFWELCGCTTRGASENQFYNGTGWWRFFDHHIKCVTESERARRSKYSYDSGVGILYWRNNYRGCVKPININMVKEGHCSEIQMLKSYKEAPNHYNALRDLPHELDSNYSLDEISKRLEIDQYL